MGDANIKDCKSLGGITVDVVNVPKEYEGDQFCNVTVEKNFEPGKPPKKKSGLSLGAIIAIAVCAGVVVIAAVVVAVVIILKKRKSTNADDLKSDINESSAA